MKERPILFSTPMVQAILAGRKTQTRRVVKARSPEDFALFINMEAGCNVEKNSSELARCRSPYGNPGDVLWVRETWCWEGDTSHQDLDPVGFFWFKADFKDDDGPSGWRPSIHMPKRYARIWLQIEDVRVERLWDITEEDAIAEGILWHKWDIDYLPRYKDYLADAFGYGHPEHDYPTVGIAKTSFSTLWRSINGSESWAENPWVWVVKFKVLSTTGKPNLS